MDTSLFWWGVLEKVVGGVISGSILILLGLFLYKRVRKKQTFDEAKIQKELRLQYVVNEFKRMRSKYTKPLAENSSSSQVEQELSFLFGACSEIIDLCKEYNIKVDSDIHLLMNHIFYKKGVLYCNNPVAIADEKIPMFNNMEKMKLDGVKFNKDSSRIEFFKSYQEFEKQLKIKLTANDFFKTYWKNQN